MEPTLLCDSEGSVHTKELNEWVIEESLVLWVPHLTYLELESGIYYIQKSGASAPDNGRRTVSFELDSAAQSRRPGVVSPLRRRP